MNHSIHRHRLYLFIYTQLRQSYTANKKHDLQSKQGNNKNVRRMARHGGDNN